MKEKQFYRCEDCGLHYDDEDLARQCYEFCIKHNACNIEITAHSVETKAEKQSSLTQ